MVTPAGLEPATFCLEGRRSIQLSYGAALFASYGEKPRLSAGLFEFVAIRLFTAFDWGISRHIGANHHNILNINLIDAVYP